MAKTKISIDPFDAAVGVFWTLVGGKLVQHGITGVRKSVKRVKR